MARFRWIPLILSACAIAAGCSTGGAGPSDTGAEAPDSTYYPVDSLVRLYSFSDAVLVADLVEVRPEVYVQPPGEDEIAVGVEPLTETVYDGLVFRPIQWIRGPGGDEVVVQTPIVMRDVDTGEVVALSDPGPVSADDVGRRFLLFLTDRTSAPGLWAYAHGLFGAPHVDNDGQLVVPATPGYVNPLGPYRGRPVDDLLDVLRGYGS